MDIKKIIQEEVSKVFEIFSSSPMQRFNRGIYLTYVEQNKYNDFKRVSKEEFSAILSSRLDKIKTITYDKEYIYRMADEKDVWLSNRGNTLGEVWKEGDLESYWISTDL